VDLGTSSVRTLCFGPDGSAIPESETQSVYAMDVTPDGGVFIDAERLFDLLAGCVDRALSRFAAATPLAAAVGMTSFWHSLLGLDATGRPATPLLSWADSRSAPDAAALRATHDAAAILQRTGCRLHSSYWPAKLRWLARTQPATFARVAHWVSFADYASLRLAPAAGLRTSVSLASGTGLLDVHRLDWDDETLAMAGIDRATLPALVDADAGAPLGAEFGRRWPALTGAPWFPALGDGACANVGSGAIGSSRIALTLGTSGAMRLVLPAPAGANWRVPPDLWAYRLDRARAVLGGALSNGGNLLAWLRQLLALAPDSADMAAAAALPPDHHGLTILPFVAGERSPAWHDAANGIVAGLTLATRPEHLLRAAMEAVAYRFARIDDALRPLAAEPHQIVANGGAILNSPAWLQITADALSHPLIALPPADEASARGAALMASVAAGLLPDLAAAPDPAAGCPVYVPDPERTERYRAGRLRQERLEALFFPTADAGHSDVDS
ncbi:MAG TPA: gluconokinase, partial [Thermomicrobiales bacterium]|nr:gluconokinase [Thermomicrobiales bacterium]